MLGKEAACSDQLRLVPKYLECKYFNTGMSAILIVKYASRDSGCICIDLVEINK